VIKIIKFVYFAIIIVLYVITKEKIAVISAVLDFIWD